MLEALEWRFCCLSVTNSQGMTYHAVGLAGRDTTQVSAMPVRVDI
jgi:hypothetical protein